MLQSIQFPEGKVQQYLDCDVRLPMGKIPDTRSNTQLTQNGCKSKLKTKIKLAFDYLNLERILSKMIFHPRDAGLSMVSKI